ncbi:hypothetical protein [Pedobacter alpinus]|uniref:Uncharacterized protein n=1 Tax=Pedobacter alpinus TaxID=1590643 RepID=A0ABW5TTR7_9SPHI
MKVLITTASHFASYQLAYLLKNEEVLFGDNFENFPPSNSNAIAHQLLAFCLDHQIEQLYPLRSSEIIPLLESEVLFSEYGIEIMLTPNNLNHFNVFDKEVSTFAELSSGLIALGYPNQTIAIADAENCGDMILLDDAVNDNSLIWNQINRINFNQLGKWFNQSSFKKLQLHKVTGMLQQFYVLIYENKILSYANISAETLAQLNNIQSQNKLKGLMHVVSVNNQMIRIKNAAL